MPEVEASMTIDEARALVADSALWPKVRDFLWDFAQQIHPSWLDLSNTDCFVISSNDVRSYRKINFDIKNNFFVNDSKNK